MKRRETPVAETIGANPWPPGELWIKGWLRERTEDPDAQRWADAIERGDLSILDEAEPSFVAESGVIRGWLPSARSRVRGLR